MSPIKVSETIVKSYHAKIKEKEAYIKFFEGHVDVGKKINEIRKTANASYSYICDTNVVKLPD
jgi:hypothetical protein